MVERPLVDPQVYRRLPARFRRAARELLLCLNRPTRTDGGRREVSLTPDTIDAILQRAAFPVSQWGDAQWVRAQTVRSPARRAAAPQPQQAGAAGGGGPAQPQPPFVAGLAVGQMAGQGVEQGVAGGGAPLAQAIMDAVQAQLPPDMAAGQPHMIAFPMPLGQLAGMPGFPGGPVPGAPAGAAGGAAAAAAAGAGAGAGGAAAGGGPGGVPGVHMLQHQQLQQGNQALHVMQVAQSGEGWLHGDGGLVGMLGWPTFAQPWLPADVQPASLPPPPPCCPSLLSTSRLAWACRPAWAPAALAPVAAHRPARPPPSCSRRCRWPSRWRSRR